MSTQSKLKCGVVMPISAIDDCDEQHWQDVLKIIQESLEETPFACELVSTASESGTIQKRIVQNLYESDILVCDVSCKNANVMLELGMRLAFDKPLIIIKDNKTTYSFDTSPIEHLLYPRDLHYPTVQIFKVKLKDKVVHTHAASQNPSYTTFLKHFGSFKVAAIEERHVSREDYVLDSINELAKQVQNLGNELHQERTVRALGNALANARRDTTSASVAFTTGSVPLGKIRFKEFAPNMIADTILYPNDPNKPKSDY